MSRAGAPRQQPGGRRERVAAQRATAERAQRRNRLLLAGGAIVAVAAIGVGIALSAGGPAPAKSSGSTATPLTGTALDQVVATTTSVPVATSDKVGAGQGVTTPTRITGAPLTSGGKPEMLYMGGEFCPYCAAERWSMVVALSRFGTFGGLATTHSAAKDGGGTPEPYPDTATWTFANSTFSSSYLTFTPVELWTNVPDPSTGGYTTLQTPTAEQETLATKYGGGSIPFVDFGNKYAITGASYNPGVLSGLTWSQIADDLHNPDSPVAKAVLGTANYMTAAICSLTGNQPASACTSVVRSLQAKL